MNYREDAIQGVPRTEFERAVEKHHPDARRAFGISTLVVNVGLICNLSCELCHLSCSPERDEMMSRATMLDAVHFASDVAPDLLDITGGEPALWPHLREFVTLARDTAPRIRVCTNLDALLLPELAEVAPTLAHLGIELLASLPEALEGRTIGRSVEALQRLGRIGYGDPAQGAAIPLDLAYNPMPAELPGRQADIEAQFRGALGAQGITFRSLIAIANMPLGSFGAWLEETNERERYRADVRKAFNAATLPVLFCRDSIEIAWDGTLWDCDFNLAAHKGLAEGSPHLRDYVGSPVGQLALGTRRINFGEHCWVCAANLGSGPCGELL